MIARTARAVLAAGLLALSFGVPAHGRGHAGGGHAGHFSGGGSHGGSHFHSRVFIGGTFYGPAYWPPYSPYYEYPYYYPPAVVEPPVEYLQPAPAQLFSYYYCPSSRAYYPYVQQCPSGWQQVPAQPPS